MAEQIRFVAQAAPNEDQVIADVAVFDANGAPVTVGAGGAVAAATPTAAGVVKQGTHIAALAAAPTQADFNNLLTVLQTAGILATS